MELQYGSLVSIAGFAVTLALAIPNLWSIASTARSTHYSQLDSMYMEILQIALDKPCLRDPDHLPEHERAAYDCYAFIVWNFLETVRDRCAGDGTLQSIWGPVIAAEYAIHRDWFYRETVPYKAKLRPKFRVEFVDFIWTRFGGPNASASGNVLRPGGEWILDSWKPRSASDIEKTAGDWLEGPGSPSDPAALS